MSFAGSTPAEHFDYLVIGAGPSGLQMGYFLQQSGRSFCILEQAETPGSFFKAYPRHRRLISVNKVYTGYDDQEINMRWDWNSLLCDVPALLFKHYSREYFPSADVMVRYLEDFAEHYALPIRYGDAVEHIARDGDFTVRTCAGRVYTARRLIMAAGLTRAFLPDCPGIELAERYVDVSIDPEEYANKRVLIIGKGNSGFETAENLIGTAATIHIISPNPLRMAWKTHHVGHLRAINNSFLDTYQLKLQNAALDGTLTSIVKTGDSFEVSISYTHAAGETETLVYDRVILCAGFEFDFSIFEQDCKPRAIIANRFPEQSAGWESTNIPDLFFIGNLMQARDFKKTNSGFIHGFRYNIRALHRMLEERYEGVSWPSERVQATPDALVKAIEKRLNRSSALWQLNSFLCDVAVLSDDGEELVYYEEYPIAYLREHWVTRKLYLTVNLEFGTLEGDPFAIERNPDPSLAMLSKFLHPVVRCYQRGCLVAEHHVLEDLAGEWHKEDMHLGPMRKFLSQEFALLFGHNEQAAARA